MSVYTEVVLGCALKEDTPEAIVEELRIWLGLVSRDKVDSSKEYYGTFDEYSHYLPGALQRSLEASDGEPRQYFLTLRASIRNNYEGINRFLTFLAPYCEDDGFVGYLHTELYKEPFLVFFQQGKVSYRKVTAYEELALV